MLPRDGNTAVRRFGLGAKPGDLRRIAADPRGYVLSCLEGRNAATIDRPSLEPSHVVFAAAEQARIAQRLARAQTSGDLKLKAEAGETPQAGQPAMPMPNAAPDGATAGQKGAPNSDAPGARPGEIRRDAFQDEAVARFEHASATDDALLERLVMFWSGHFCVSAAKGAVRGIAGAYEREAIRPHILGRFSDMLLAVAQHPAMLVYLDNAQSTGPNSQAGKNRGLGLNENLAREILELHSLGVDGGYVQADVASLARLLTGWSVGSITQKQSLPGKFFFATYRHEPGAATVLGRTYHDEGQRSGERVLRDLARHPSTARHIALKLAVHFVGERPPHALVERLRTAFLDSDGDLRAVTQALVTSPEAWAAEPAKVLPPYDFLVSIVRGFAPPAKPLEALRITAALGEPLWRPSSPKGWPTGDDVWMGPSAVRERLRVAEKVARQIDRAIDPRAVAEDLLGAGMTSETREAIARAETREQGLELLMMSPEFQKR